MENVSSLEELYKNASFDYLDDTYENETVFDESINTTEDFLVNLEYNFYQ